MFRIPFIKIRQKALLMSKLHSFLAWREAVPIAHCLLWTTFSEQGNQNTNNDNGQRCLNYINGTSQWCSEATIKFKQRLETAAHINLDPSCSWRFQSQSWKIREDTYLSPSLRPPSHSWKTRCRAGSTEGWEVSSSPPSSQSGEEDRGQREGGGGGERTTEVS